jgi:3-deoxy-D-manno-octulosonic-acid transferase
MLLLVYRILINLILILSPIIIIIRILKKKEHPIRFREKLCFFSKKKVKGKLIWFHGASVGEILSVIPLIEKLEKKVEIKQILITSNTLSSSKILASLKLKKTIHQFLPIDTNYHTKKFLNYWKPSIAIFIDSEIWPNIITNIKKESIPLLLLNARITKKSFKKWKKFTSSAKSLFNKFDLCLSSNNDSVKYLKILGAKKIKYIGNLKFTQSEKNNNEIDDSLKKKFSFKHIWCASSTHPGEEKYCALIHKKLKRQYKGLLTVIIPRHVDRVKKITKEMGELDLNIHTHNSQNKMNKNTDIYLVDSYGLNKSFLKICKIVFLGGSIIKHGGQNPLEAARYGCKILHGPNVWNFKEIYSLLKKFKISNKINSINQMTRVIDDEFKNKMSSQKIKLKIKKIGNKILNNTLKEINYFIIKK